MYDRDTLCRQIVETAGDAIIFADREGIEIRSALVNLLAEFSRKHRRNLENWTGNMNIFEGDESLVQKYFADFM